MTPSASHARGTRFGSRQEHSSFSLKSPDIVPVAPRVAFSGMGQAKIENNLFIYLCREDDVHPSFVYHKPQWIVAKSGSFVKSITL